MTPGPWSIATVSRLYSAENFRRPPDTSPGPLWALSRVSRKRGQNPSNRGMAKVDVGHEEME